MMEKIIKLNPAYKDYLWGGTKLRDEYDKNCNFSKVAESWEVSCHPDGPSTVAEGEYKGITLQQYIEMKGIEILGKKGKEYGMFPILNKFIDAKQGLSIQVHPDDEYARKIGKKNGKTELWYIAECEENAFIYYGVNQNITKEEFQKRIENHTLLEVLNKVNVHKGDSFLVKAGTIHAIGAGIVIYEIQQNSNCTFRVYDFDRRGADGKPRELHIKEALEASNLTKMEMPVSTDNYENSGRVLGSCEYFTVLKYKCNKEINLENCEDSFRTLTIMEGNITICIENETVSGKKGESFFIPANAGKVRILGSADFIVVKG